MATANEDAALRPTAVLAAFSESLIAGRRTAVLGDSSDDLPGRLATSSRRRVHVFDPDQQRVGRAIAASRGSSEPVLRAPLDQASEVAHGTFDAVVIPELGLFDDAGAVLDLARELLSPRGVTLLCAANRGGELEQPSGELGYYALYDLVAERFDQVRMLGQAPFAGYTVAEFASVVEPAVTIDASLAQTSEEAEWFVVVASQAPVIDPYVLVQVPSAAARAWALEELEEPATEALAELEADAARVRAELERARSAERAAASLAAERETALAKLSARLAERHVEVERAVAEAAALRVTEDELRKRLRQRTQELERSQADRDRLEETHQVELDAMLERIAELEEEQEKPPTSPAPAESPPSGAVPALAARGYEFQIAELREALSRARAERDQAKAESARVAELDAQVATLLREREIERRAQEAAAPIDGDEEQHGRELGELERGLRERGKLVDGLRADLRESDRIGRELLARLQQAQASPAPRAEGDTESLRRQLDALGLRCNRYEADLHAAGWRIDALTRELEDRQDATDHVKLEDALRAALEELAALRHRLTERSSA